MSEETKFDPKGGLLKAVEGESPLSGTFDFWFVKRQHGPRSKESYERNIRRIARVSTVDEFWGIYAHLVRPNDLGNSCDFNFFRAGVKPMWEDPANVHGGKFMVRMRKGLASRYWEDLLLAVVGEQLGVGDELCGIGVSIRYNEDVLSIWHKTASNADAKRHLYEGIAKALPLLSTMHACIEYKEHSAAQSKGAAPSKVSKAKNEEE